MKVRDIIKRVEKDGWREVKAKGSHRQYKHLVKSGRVTIPGHPGDDVAIGVSVMQYTVIVEKAANNYSAYVPDLPGCISTGSTIEETKRNIQEAIEFHPEGMCEDGDPIPEPTSTAIVVEVAA